MQWNASIKSESKWNKEKALLLTNESCCHLSVTEYVSCQVSDSWAPRLMSQNLDSNFYLYAFQGRFAIYRMHVICISHARQTLLHSRSDERWRLALSLISARCFFRKRSQILRRRSHPRTRTYAFEIHRLQRSEASQHSSWRAWSRTHFRLGSGLWFLQEEASCQRVSWFGYCCKKILSWNLINFAVHRGTHGYMAPEVLAKGVPYDSSADWFSFGCMVFKLIKG